TPDPAAPRDNTDRSRATAQPAALLGERRSMMNQAPYLSPIFFFLRPLFLPQNIRCCPFSSTNFSGGLSAGFSSGCALGHVSVVCSMNCAGHSTVTACTHIFSAPL